MKTFTAPSVLVLLEFGLFLFLISSCEKENISSRTSSETLFMLEVKTITDPKEKKYVIVGDANGNVIDYKELKANTTFTFDKPEAYSSSEITITYLYINSATTIYTLSTTQQVEVGSHWTWDNATPPPSVTYNASIQVTNIPQNVMMLASPHTLISNYEISDQERNLKPGVIYPITLQKPEEDLWMRLEYTNNQPNKYYLLKNAQATTNYIVDLSAFEVAASKTIALKESGFSVSAATLWNIQQNNSQVVFDDNISRHSDLPQPTSILRLFYPNTSADNYWIYTALDKDLFQSTLYKKEQLNIFYSGKVIPDTLPTLDADFELQKTSAQDFQMTTIGTYDSYGVAWKKEGTDATVANPSISWFASGKSQPAITIKLPSVPQELLNTTSLQLKCTSVYLSKGSNDNTTFRIRELR